MKTTRYMGFGICILIAVMTVARFFSSSSHATCVKGCFQFVGWCWGENGDNYEEFVNGAASSDFWNPNSATNLDADLVGYRFNYYYICESCNSTCVNQPTDGTGNNCFLDEEDLTQVLTRCNTAG